jgi:hypothetical protein
MSALMSLLTLVTSTAQPAPEHVTLRCNVGPIERTFGGGPWKVYSCSDGMTLVMTSATSTSNAPFMYIISFEKGRSLVNGSGIPGNGTDVATATQELRRLTAQDFAALISATKKSHRDPPTGSGRH